MSPRKRGYAAATPKPTPYPALHPGIVATVRAREGGEIALHDTIPCRVRALLPGAIYDIILRPDGVVDVVGWVSAARRRRNAAAYLAERAKRGRKRGGV